MRRYAIHTFNVCVLTLVLIGVPAATSVRLGALQIGSRPALEVVTQGALAGAILVNALGSLALAPNRRERTLWRNWALGNATVLALHIALFEGLLNFRWLRQGLLWLHSQF